MMRNATVGMTNTFRMVMSLHPRVAARDLGSSVVIMLVKARSPGSKKPGEEMALLPGHRRQDYSAG